MSEHDCPSCGRHFTEDVTSCPDCGVSLLVPGHEEATYTDLAPLTWVASLGEAYVLRSALAAQDVPVEIEDELTLTQAGGGGTPCATGGVRILVTTHLLDQARAALTELRPKAGHEPTAPDAYDRLERYLDRSFTLCWFVIPCPLVLANGLQFLPLLSGDQMTPFTRFRYLAIMIGSLLESILLLGLFVWFIHWLTA